MTPLPLIVADPITVDQTGETNRIEFRIEGNKSE